MNTGKIVFSQVMDLLPLRRFRTCVDRYRGDFKVKSFTCQDHFRVLAFAQLSHRESLRDIEICLRAMRSKLYHMGIRSQARVLHLLIQRVDYDGDKAQIMGLLLLAPDIQEQILFLPRSAGGRDPIPEKAVRPIAAVPDFRKQREMWRGLRAGLPAWR